MLQIQAIKSGSLEQGPETPGITRNFAFDAEDCRVIRARSEPGTVSGWHHHGDYDVYGYIASGLAEFEGGPDGKEKISLETGDFFLVPAHTIHREINPSNDERNDVILFLKGTGPVVVNVDHPESS